MEVYAVYLAKQEKHLRVVGVLNKDFAKNIMYTENAPKLVTTKTKTGKRENIVHLFCEESLKDLMKNRNVTIDSRTFVLESYFEQYINNIKQIELLVREEELVAPKEVVVKIEEIEEINKVLARFRDKIGLESLRKEKERSRQLETGLRNRLEEKDSELQKEKALNRKLRTKAYISQGIAIAAITAFVLGIVL